ncbi:hypothetical protein E2C01_069664 [Portunus trituberculatus]|uniref:Uncharacterized protein n=1 Tax=Portunus trituberculatus TaxID=210409 RepID=A0A5B7I064_PORTR|nr:hypothetical protein [Portunus trituberculatus]
MRGGDREREEPNGRGHKTEDKLCGGKQEERGITEVDKTEEGFGAPVREERGKVTRKGNRWKI